MSVVALPIQNHTIGASHSYCFYQELSFKSSNLRQPKQIIPSIPRQHFKAPKNSSLSPIRKQKVMPKNDEILIKRPYPLVTTFSSPASIQTTTIKKRQRKVSFDEKVIVVCTIFDEEEEDNNDENIIKVDLPTIRRHSTGETNLKSILICDQRQELVFTQKITKSLKQFKNRLLFVN